ncbi:MAG: hypothetical protein PHR35_13640 [Kiritimatiellae bacterium]|nr:hypothetical protein [Kiritimatiellia bacterium]
MKKNGGARIWTLAFPSILDGLGPENVVAEVAAMRADELVICGQIYTGYRLVMPRHPDMIYQMEEGRHFHPVNKSLYAQTLIQPEETADFAGKDLIGQAIGAGRKAGVGIAVWLSLFANGRVAKTYPECAVENLYGNRDRLFLCFNNPHVRQYIFAWIEDVLRRYELSTLFLDKIPQTLLEARSLTGVVDPPLRVVGSLCFCPSCKRAAAADGLDLEAAHRRALEIGENSRRIHQWTKERLSDDLKGDTEVPLFLLEEKGIYDVLQWRLRKIAAFLDEVRGLKDTIAPRVKVGAALVPQVKVGHDATAPRAWLAAQSYKYFAPMLDSLHSVIHWDEHVVAYDAARARDSIRSSGAAPEFCVHLPAYGRTSPNDIAGLADTAVSAGADAVAFFCQDLMEPPMLDAIGQWANS